jgi:tetraacyldisaccharide 4'-kinase
VSACLRLLYEKGERTGWVKVAWPALVVLSWLYALGVMGLRTFIRLPFGSRYRPRAKVVSVGNIVMGGTGKTPLVRLVAEHLYRRDRRTAVLVRGYKRPSVAASRGRAGRVRADGASDFERLGDEGAWLKQVLCAKADVFAAADRRKRTRQLDASGRYEAFVLDDGFQHWRLCRDLDIVAVDATRGLGNGFLIPAGPLREEPRALRRARLVCLTRADEVTAAACHALKSRIARWAPDAAFAELGVRPQELIDAKTGATHDPAWLKEKKVGLFCGIGNPSSFTRTVKDLGAEVVYEKPFPDHHVFSRQDLVSVAREAAGRGARLLCTTEKDVARLAGILPEDIEVKAVAVTFVFIRGQEDFYGRLDSLFVV